MTRAAHIGSQQNTPLSTGDRGASGSREGTGSRWLRALPRVAVAAALVAAATLDAGSADAQANTFYLDRLQIGGAPDDSFALWRPQMGERTRFYGQAAFGFGLNPLRIDDTIADPNDRARAEARDQLTTPLNEQLITYLDIGFEALDRFAFQVELPVILYQNGNATNAPGLSNIQDTTDPGHAGAMDLRLDGRVILFRTDDRMFKLGAKAGLLIPTGTAQGYGSDNSFGGILDAAAELDLKKFFITANTGPLFRKSNGVDDLVVGNEWRYGLGGFVPLRDQTIRLGLQVFGSTGFNAGATLKQNTELEWLAEGRLYFLEKKQAAVSFGGGTRFLQGYSPDFRLIASIGYWFNINDTDAGSPNKRWRTAAKDRPDRDHDGIPDDIDLCPDEPEDHKPPFPDDGCPALPDRDGDGIPDYLDKCPDQPEDFDGIQDADGCPEDDADHDGIPDALDACPLEPGDPDPDPKKNGCPKFIRRIKGSSEIEILQQIQFETGSAVIKKDSYKILDEVVRLMKVNLEIKLLAIEGHTDNRGSDELNAKLSKARAKSCLDYLVSHGVEANRLSSDGFGPKRPIASNDTAEGRQKNRRTEFHIRDQSGGVKVQEGPRPGPAPGPGPGPSSPPPPNNGSVPLTP
ncbi:MAG TPA: OmpA family protein [Byssovorax sp.]